jgi:hypothetical protein
MAGFKAKFFIEMFCRSALFICCELDNRNIMLFGITNGLIKHLNLAEVSLPQPNQLQTGWVMSTSPTAILADFDNNASSYHHPW